MNDIYSRIVVCAFLLLIIPVSTFARIAEPEIIDADSSSRHSFYAGGGYGNNMVYLGSTISENQPYLYSSLTYGYANKFYASFSAVHLYNNSFPAFLSGSLNYNHVFSSWFDISAGISAYKFSSAPAHDFIDQFIYTDLTLGIDWRLLYTQLSAGLLYFEQASPYLQVKNSRYFATPDLWKGKFNISFDPYVNVLMGKYYSTETIEGTAVFAPIPGKGKGRPVPQSTVYKERFGIMEADIGIPVSFNFNRFTIEAEPGFVLQFKGNSEYTGPKGFLFLINGYFRIF